MGGKSSQIGKIVNQQQACLLSEASSACLHLVQWLLLQAVIKAGRAAAHWVLVWEGMRNCQMRAVPVVFLIHVSAKIIL